MKPEQLLEILGVANNLKLNTRHCYTQPDRKESVADHSWRIALMAMLLDGVEEYKEFDMNKVIRMCLIHDLGEAFTGDIPAFLKKNSDEGKEEEILVNWFGSFPEPQRSEWLALLAEMSALETNEARLYKSLDRIEALISHNESDIATWLPLEYDLQLTYGKEQMKFSPYMMELRKAVDDWTVRKIEESKKAVE
ncbi:MAG: HD domain-containing protein [Erysipelotrichaceae bacterium]|nr:HD domain-containing protein [Erysipelotrichaceae bacterium]